MPLTIRKIVVSPMSGNPSGNRKTLSIHNDADVKIKMKGVGTLVLAMLKFIIEYRRSDMMLTIYRRIMN